MNVRAATSADVPVLEALWRAFEGEVPPPAHVELDLARELAELREAVDDGLAFVAEVDGEAVGFALARRTGSRLARLTDLYVVPEARRGGVAAALVHAVVEADDVWELLSPLKAAGASSILVLPVERLVA